jgi:hypothetical protein
MIQKGVDMERLFKSEILNHTLDFVEWPDIHHDTRRILVPYSETFFTTRFSYHQIFPQQWAEEEEEKARMELDGGKAARGAKRYKIQYQMNILTNMTEDGDLSLMHVLASSDELEIFNLDLVKDVIDYKWYTYAFKIHALAAIVHASYVFVLILYIKHYYLD